jgi:hypothetical protein
MAEKLKLLDRMKEVSDRLQFHLSRRGQNE